MFNSILKQSPFSLITKKQISVIRSLNQKKFRDEYQLFVVEGDKIVSEVLKSFYRPKEIYATLDWINKNPDVDAQEVTNRELAQISGQSAPNGVVALVHMQDPISLPTQFSGLSLLLDSISDPGNMGTILRLADWFSVQYVVCSPHCVDRYNPKVIQASMGSFVRIKHVYTELNPLIKTLRDAIPIYAMVLEGSNIYDNPFEPNSLVVIGNESRGISEKLLQNVDKRITIPTFGNAESLNAAIAAGITCSEYRRVNG